MDEQKALLQGLWRKAVTHPEPLRIPCKTAANATKLRFALYNAVSKVRAGKEPGDEALQRAIEQCSISMDPDDKSILIIQQKVMTELMQTLVGLLGDEPELQKTGEQMALETSQETFMRKLAQDPSDPGSELGRATPYYTR